MLNDGVNKGIPKQTEDKTLDNLKSFRVTYTAVSKKIRPSIAQSGAYTYITLFK